LHTTTERMGRALTLVAGGMVLASCNEGVLSPKGPIGQAEQTILFNATAIMLAVIIPVIALTLTFAWWFRASNKRARYQPDWEYSGRIEMIVWSIPALVVLFLGGIAWISSHDLDPYKPVQSQVSPVEVNVVSLDWKWLFIYPDKSIASINELTVPVGTPIHFHLTSGTVMNSFFVPQLGSQIYTMAGMTSELNLLADTPGVYRGLSAQFSGDGFSDMHFNVKVVTASDFAAWLAKVRGSGEKLDDVAYQKLLLPGIEPNVRIYGTVDPGIFESILLQPAEGVSPYGAPGRPPHLLSKSES